jgi:hypothetical protein
MNRLLAALMFLITSHSSAQHITVPRGTPVMVDGKISPGEWRDAKSVASGDSRIWVKQASGFVFIAVQFPADAHGFTDLMISTAPGQRIDLHASAKLGERTMSGHGWTEWKWWNNEGWTANVSRVDSFDNKVFFPEKVREYQIRRDRFPAKTWKVMVQLSIEGKDGAYHQIALPENANENVTSTWLQLTFSPQASFN